MITHSLVFTIAVVALLVLGIILIINQQLKRVELNKKIEYKGQLKYFPENVVNKMLDYQEEQTGKRDITVFEENVKCSKVSGGFHWANTEEGYQFWYSVIIKREFYLLD